MSAVVDATDTGTHTTTATTMWLRRSCGGITTTNHKDTRTLYLWLSCSCSGVGGIMAVVIRAELFSPGLQFVDPDFFNQLNHHARRS